MNQAIKTRWIARLRSGEIEQGHQYLGFADGKRCCLGILCDIAVEDGVISAPMPEGAFEALVYDNTTDLLPRRVQEWAELDSNDPLPGTFTRTLSNMNDDEAPFTYIADVIERHL